MAISALEVHCKETLKCTCALNSHSQILKKLVDSIMRWLPVIQQVKQLKLDFYQMGTYSIYSSSHSGTNKQESYNICPLKVCDSL